MNPLTLLARNALDSQEGDLIGRSLTAYGKRLVDLSEAMDLRTLSDEAIVRYLDEVSISCERQFLTLRSLLGDGGLEQSHKNLLSYLESIIDIVEQFEDINHQDLLTLVQKAELLVTLAAVALNGRVAA